MLSRRLLVSGALGATLVAGTAAAQAPTPGIDTTSFDRGVRPQDDFFRYVNGGWVKKTDIPADRTHILSTGAMLDEARKSTARKVLVATEIGMLHQLRKVNTRTTFLPMNPAASCRFMKMTTPELLLRALREGRDEVVVPAGVAARARRAVERMIAIGTPGSGE